MTKLLSVVIAAMFAAVSVNAIAASHAGAPMEKSAEKKTEKKTEKKKEAKPKKEAKKADGGDKAMEKKDAAKK